MKLYEFFGGSVFDKDADYATDPRDELSGKKASEDQKLADEIYWYILDDDQLHKEFFIPLAHEIHQKQRSKEFDHGEYIKRWMPMVNKACKKYYKEHQLQGHPADLFSKEMRKSLCDRLAEQHHKDIEKGEYDLGKS